MVTASQAFPGPDSDQRVKEVRSWLNSKGVRDFEPVSLSSDQLGKVIYLFSCFFLFVLLIF
jgi:hypothetical protein